MPLNVGKFGASWFLVLIFSFGVVAQSPTSGDVLRERVKKARAWIAVKSYTAAIYELENIRRETSDPAVNGVVQVMLMNCYLEQGDYKRAQQLLNELYNAQKINKPNANYYSVAAQVVKGARSQLDRYKNLGLAVSDRNLPIEAVNDVNKMREMVEEVITQSRTLSGDKKQAALVMPLLEEAISARSGLARDDYDAKRWKEEIADTRESLVNARSVVVNVDESAAQPGPNALASTGKPIVQTPSENNTAMLPVNNPVNNSPVNNSPLTAAAETEKKPQTETAKPNVPQTETAKTTPANNPEKQQETAPEANKQVAQNQNSDNANRTPNVQQPPTRSRLVSNAQPTETAANNGSAVNPDAPLTVGSLVDYATEKVSPTYPQAARVMRMTGIVRIEVVVDENGGVQVENTTGPAMLQRAALEAVKKWKFKPFVRDGQPVKAKGYVNFNFNL